MKVEVSRRDVLMQIGTAGAGLLLPRGIMRGQSTYIFVAGKRVESAMAALSPSTARMMVESRGSRPVLRGRERAVRLCYSPANPDLARLLAV